jgi:hypothetical protein
LCHPSRRGSAGALPSRLANRSTNPRDVPLITRTTTLEQHLDLLAGAGMLVGRRKCAARVSLQHRSRPKLQVLDSALMTAQTACRSRTPFAIESNGDGVESAVGWHVAKAADASICEAFCRPSKVGRRRDVRQS